MKVRSALPSLYNLTKGVFFFTSVSRPRTSTILMRVLSFAEGNELSMFDVIKQDGLAELLVLSDNA